MNEFKRRYRITLIDQNNLKWYLVLRENREEKEYRIRATLSRIDSRTSDFSSQNSLLETMQNKAYQVVVTNSKKTKIVLEGESVPVDRLIILEDYAPEFEQFLISKKCVLKKIDNVKFGGIAIEYNENGHISNEPVLYSDNNEVKKLAASNQYSSTVDFNDQFVKKVYHTFEEMVLQSPNKNATIRFLTSADNSKGFKYMDKELLSKAYDYMMCSNISDKLDAEQALKQSFTNYKVVRDLWLGMELYKLIKETINVPKQDTIPEIQPVYKEPVEHDDLTNNQYSLFNTDDNDQSNGGREKTLGEMPR